MQIFVKTLTGKTITLVSTSVPAVPDLKQSGSHLRVGPHQALMVSAGGGELRHH